MSPLPADRRPLRRYSLTTSEGVTALRPDPEGLWVSFAAVESRVLAWANTLDAAVLASGTRSPQDDGERTP